MTVNEFIHSLPISEENKSVLIDISVAVGVALFNVYDKNMVTIIVSSLGVLILMFRGVTHYYNMRKAFHENEIAQHNAEVLKQEKEEAKVVPLKKT
jgi:hypothetical protein